MQLAAAVGVEGHRSIEGLWAGRGGLTRYNPSAPVPQRGDADAQR
jgi:hypothetical protein